MKFVVTSEIGATELRCIQLKSRILKFFCPECRQGFSQVPELRKEVKELKQKVEELIAKANDSIRNSGSNNVSDSYSADQVVQEIQERNIRKNNIIVFGLPEQPNQDGDKNIILDMLRLVNL
nr:unnamed protein product [Callosobruchus chinensis]